MICWIPLGKLLATGRLPERVIYQQCEHLSEKVGCEITMPFITAKQQHRSNPQSASALDYFKKAVAIPFLGFIVSSLEKRFSRSAFIATSLLSPGGLRWTLFHFSVIDLYNCFQKCVLSFMATCWLVLVHCNYSAIVHMWYYCFGGRLRSL